MKENRLNMTDKDYAIASPKGGIILLSNNRFSRSNLRFCGTDKFLSGIDDLLRGETDFYIIEVFVSVGKIYLTYKSRTLEGQYGRITCCWCKNFRLEFEVKREGGSDPDGYILEYEREYPGMPKLRDAYQDDRFIRVREYICGTEIDEFIIFPDGTICSTSDGQEEPESSYTDDI